MTEKNCKTCWNSDRLGNPAVRTNSICWECSRCSEWIPSPGFFIQGELANEESMQAKPVKQMGNNNPGMTGQYTFRGGIEPLDFVLSNKMDFLEGNVVKYVYRYPFKGGLEALRKAQLYLSKLIERVEREEKARG